LSKVDFLHNNIQQGSYLQEWESGFVSFDKISMKIRIKSLLREMPFFQILKRANFFSEIFASDRLNSKNPNLIKLKVKDLLNF
jgi:hypothetical protein